MGRRAGAFAFLKKRRGRKSPAILWRRRGQVQGWKSAADFRGKRALFVEGFACHSTGCPSSTLSGYAACLPYMDEGFVQASSWYDNRTVYRGTPAKAIHLLLALEQCWCCKLKANVSKA